MIEIRILKPEEYGLLDAIPEPDAVKLNPENTWVAAAFKNGKLIGRLVALSLPHIECAWIAPRARKSSIGARLESCLTKKLRELGAQLAVAYATDETMESYVQRLGYKRLATAWRKDL